VKIFIGEVHNFIGDNFILLAKKLFYWRFFTVYWRKLKFIGELEISSDFFQFAHSNSLLFQPVLINFPIKIPDADAENGRVIYPR